MGGRTERGIHCTVMEPAVVEWQMYAPFIQTGFSCIACNNNISCTYNAGTHTDDDVLFY